MFYLGFGILTSACPNARPKSSSTFLKDPTLFVPTNPYDVHECEDAKREPEDKKLLNPFQMCVLGNSQCFQQNLAPNETSFKPDVIFYNQLNTENNVKLITWRDSDHWFPLKCTDKWMD